jgi:hypothetical protein
MSAREPKRRRDSLKAALKLLPDIIFSLALRHEKDGVEFIFSHDHIFTLFVKHVSFIAQIQEKHYPLDEMRQFPNTSDKYVALFEGKDGRESLDVDESTCSI